MPHIAIELSKVDYFKCKQFFLKDGIATLHGMCVKIDNVCIDFKEKKGFWIFILGSGFEIAQFVDSYGGIDHFCEFSLGIIDEKNVLEDCSLYYNEDPEQYFFYVAQLHKKLAIAISNSKIDNNEFANFILTGKSKPTLIKSKEVLRLESELRNYEPYQPVDYSFYEYREYTERSGAWEVANYFGSR